jgi:calcineurin-like phosphoesterase family protein
MSNSWVIADTHFGHRGVCTFLHPNGIDPLRPWHTPEEMDEALVKNWNDVVKPNDRVNLLGDVVINRRCLVTLGRLNGRIRLVKGNHDIFKLTDYLPYVDDIAAYHVTKGANGGKVIMSHIPIHTESLGRFGINIHGHLHAHVVTKEVKYKTELESWIENVQDKRYVCVSVEQTNWRPITLEEAISRAEPTDESVYSH